MTQIPRRAVPVVMPVDETPVPTVPVAARPTEADDRPRRRYRDDDSDDDRPRRRRRVRHPSPNGFLITLAFFSLMMIVMLGYSFLLGVYLGVSHEGDVPPDILRREMRGAQIVVSTLHVFVVAAAVAVTWRPGPKSAIIPRAYGWALGPPALVAMLALNFGFGFVVRFIFNVKPPEDAEIISFVAEPALAVLLICVQPAVVEEVFFRFLLLGHFRTHVNVHAAVFLSSTFFMAAHLGQIGGWPVLFVLGCVLGYARVCTGGLLLPIILHFLHNLAVIGLGPLIEGRAAGFS